MKTTITAVLFLSIPLFATAQLQYLRLSPLQKLEQRVGLTDISIEYSRPGMKGRVIFGDLVPYDKMWRAGANENTKITFSHRVKVGGQELAAGTYALFTKPGRTDWDIFFYTDTDNLDVPDPLEQDKIVAHFTVPSRTDVATEESLVINIYNITETTADIGIRWENTEVRIPIECYTREVMEEKMKEVFAQNAMDFGIAASYYRERGIALEKAKALQELSMEISDRPSSWAYNSYAIILSQLGKIDEAKEAATQSLKLARESNNQYLITANEELLEKLAKDHD